VSDGTSAKLLFLSVPVCGGTDNGSRDGKWQGVEQPCSHIDTVEFGSYCAGVGSGWEGKQIVLVSSDQFPTQWE
jgi:hypothetical protein